MYYFQTHKELLGESNSKTAEIYVFVMIRSLEGIKILLDFIEAEKGYDVLTERR
jgi:hypothetical protein